MRGYEASLLLSHGLSPDEHRVREDIYISKAHLPCNMIQSAKVDWLHTHYAHQVAVFIENSSKFITQQKNPFTKMAEELIRGNVSERMSLPKLQLIIPILNIGFSLLKNAKLTLMRIKENDFSLDELRLEQNPSNLILFDPISLLNLSNERKLDKITRAQVDTILKMGKAIQHENKLRHMVQNPRKDLSEAFRAQQDLLPSFAREKVSFSHLARMYSLQQPAVRG